MLVHELATLDVWVTDHCIACARTLELLAACSVLRSLVRVRVRRLGAGADGAPPAAVVGGPAIVFLGSVIALGTPDCAALAERIIALLGSQRGAGGSPCDF